MQRKRDLPIHRHPVHGRALRGLDPAFRHAVLLRLRDDPGGEGAPRILKRDFRPGFFVEHFIKDMGIALKEAERMNLTLPGLALVHQLYVAVEAQGHGRKGTQALMLALEKISNLRM